MVIIEDRGKQYKVKVGDILKLPKILDCKAKDNIKFDKIIFHKNEKGEDKKDYEKSFKHFEKGNKIKELRHK